MNMFEKLTQLQEKTYSPYSEFQVAAILVMKDGTEIEGTNVETASYGGTICAERNAITSAITLGYKKGDFKEIFIKCGITYCIPCGLCRDFMSEFAEKDFVWNLYNPSGDMKQYLMDELLPLSFNLEEAKNG